MKWIIDCSIAREQCKNGCAAVLNIVVVNEVVKLGFVHYCRLLVGTRKTPESIMKVALHN